MDDPVSTNPTTSSPSPTTKDAASDAAGRTAGAAKQEGKAVASTAADQAKSVAGEAATQAKTVVDEARTQTSRVVSDASSELRQQVDQRLTEAAKTARATAGQLRALAEGRPDESGRSGDLARQASDRLDELAGRADELGVQGVAEELANFGRRRPLVFLAGAMVAGVAAGRMLRSLQAANASSDDANRSLPAQTGPSRLGAMESQGSRSVVAPASGATIGGGESVAPEPVIGNPGAGTVSSPGGVG